MELKIGGVYKFRFIEKFQKLETIPNGGIYRVLQKMHYNEIVDAKISIVENLYERVGLNKKQYEADLPGYVNHPFLKLQPVQDFEFEFAPTLDIQEYDLYSTFYTGILTLEDAVMALKNIYDVGNVPYTASTNDLSAAVASGKWTTVQYDEALSLITTINDSFVTLRLPYDSRNLALSNFDLLIKYNPATLPIPPERLERFMTVQTSDIIYMPMPGLESYPLTNLHEYGKIGLMMDLGVFAEPELLDASMTKIQEILTTDHGITATPRLMLYGKVWLEETTYDDMVEERDALRGTRINYYSECKRLVSENEDMLARILALEEIIKAAQP